VTPLVTFVAGLWLVRVAVEARRWRQPVPPTPLAAPRSHVTLRRGVYDQDRSV
jgi:hypothetical protein